MFNLMAMPNIPADARWWRTEYERIVELSALAHARSRTAPTPSAPAVAVVPLARRSPRPGAGVGRPPRRLPALPRAA